MNKLTYLVLFFTSLTYSQVGINKEDLTSDFEVKGSMRLRQFDSSVIPSRILVANDNGDVGFVSQGENRYTVRDVYYKMMSEEAIKPIYSNNSGLVELKLDITIDINPYTETAVFLDYNVPVTAIGAWIPSYMGVSLLKTAKGDPKIIYINEGSRKFTFYTTQARYGGGNCVTMPVTGKATDVIVNNTPNKVTFTYSAKGYIEGGQGTMYFGNVNKAETAFGVGVLIAQVFERKIE